MEDVPETTPEMPKGAMPQYSAPPMPKRQVVTNSEIDEAIIISCYFNPMKSPYRRKGFEKFYEGIKHFNHKIVECVIGDSEAELPDTFEKVYTKSLLWHKETLLNNIIKTLPAKYKYIFWLDADIIFTNPNWLQESVQVMKNGANIVQPFEFGIHLNKGELAPKFNVNAYRRNCSTPSLRHEQLWRSFCSNHPNLSGNNNYDAHGHVGFAWGIKREILDMVPGGLYDKALIGGADHIMAHAAAGHIPHNCITKSFTDDIVAVNEWSKMFYAAVQGKIGYAQGDLYHIWHGELKDRQYLKRITEFTPKAKRIQHRDENGFFITDEVDDTNYMLEYFMLREIMDDGSNVVSDDIQFGSGQTDGAGAGGSWNDNSTQDLYDSYTQPQQDSPLPQDNYRQDDSVRQDNSSYNLNNYTQDNVQDNFGDNGIHQDNTSFNLSDNNSNDYQGSTFS
jgi:hypothetical protein